MAKSPTPSTLAAALVAIVYIGRKPIAFDNVAGSGKSWAGHGDVQYVTELQANTLLKYPDQWERAPEQAPVPKQQSGDSGDLTDDPNAQGGEQDPPGGGDDNEADFTPDELAEILKSPIEKLTKPKLIAFAKHKLGRTLDPSLGKTSMVNQIEEWLAHAE